MAVVTVADPQVVSFEFFVPEAAQVELSKRLSSDECRVAQNLSAEAVACDRGDKTHIACRGTLDAEIVSEECIEDRYVESFKIQSKSVLALCRRSSRHTQKLVAACHFKTVHADVLSLEHHP